MIKSIGSAYSARKFVVYSDSLSRTFQELNTKYWLFERISKEEYENIVKKAYPDLSKEEQASMVEILEDYNKNGQYGNLKPSAALCQAEMTIQQQKEKTPLNSRFSLPDPYTSTGITSVEINARRPK